MFHVPRNNYLSMSQICLLNEIVGTTDDRVICCAFCCTQCHNKMHDKWLSHLLYFFPCPVHYQMTGAQTDAFSVRVQYGYKGSLIFHSFFFNIDTNFQSLHRRTIHTLFAPMYGDSQKNMNAHATKCTDTTQHWFIACAHILLYADTRIFFPHVCCISAPEWMGLVFLLDIFYTQKSQFML